ncbi:checkpoint protein HUS1-like isoform X2 [Branchiostoma lanceolatum]|uniref:checkpoint protein HUS1-like isoform X2 n=1 Tax=Branchiostoma lanceolatum TaxID=7740 RepID=UPI003456C5A6
MRFRAKIVDIACIQHFTRVVSTISKLCKTCTFRLTPGKIYFILSEQVANGGVSMWCELPQANFFDQFQMEGVSAEDNEIYLELVPDNMSRALKSAQAAKLVKIKLTKKHAACLTFDIELPSLTNQSRTVVHDVPVNVIARRLWGEYQEPAMPQFDVMSANRNGDMTLKVETDMAEVTTLFRDLEIPSWSREEESGVSQSDRDPEEMAEARVDIRKFSQFLAGQQVNPDRVICNIVDGNILHFFVLHEDLSLQYFIPTVAL